MSGHTTCSESLSVLAIGMQRLNSALLSFYCLVGGWPLLAENSLRGDERLWASL